MDSKKKIGIITILQVNNYGAELQAFALCHKLNQLGYDAEIINYLFYKNPGFKSTKGSQPFIKLDAKQKLKEALYPYFKKFKSIPYAKQKKIRDEKFSTFHSDNTRLTAPINTYEKLYKANLNYDVYIVGSDQVWNPNTNTNIEPYFLTFADKSKLKLSYASSFGVSKIPTIYHEKYRDLIGNLDAIGVREKTGVSIVKDITDKNATWVLDPTLLLDKAEWAEFSIPSTIEEPFLLMYVLTDSAFITDLANKIAKEKNLRIVRICKNAFVEDKNPEIINIIDAGPKEYLGLFAKASFVLTTSFHGTCFSVNFNIPFYAVLKKHKLNNSRIVDLLKDLDIPERILYIDDTIPNTSGFDMDYHSVQEKLELKKTQSLNYLTEALAIKK